MNTSPQPQSSKPRDRRKARLQAEIRRHAFRLFSEQGYAETSVEQIAAAADISYSTFFRYFATKSAIAADMRFNTPFIEALENQPKDVPLAQAIQVAVSALSETLSTDDLVEIRTHYGTFTRIPELQAGGFVNLSKDARTLTDIIAVRLNQSRDTLEIQTLAWSIIGSWIAAVHYWIAHPESDLFMTLDSAMRGVMLSAQAAWPKIT